jgi:hypothetical protein
MPPGRRFSLQVRAHAHHAARSCPGAAPSVHGQGSSLYCLGTYVARAYRLDTLVPHAAHKVREWPGPAHHTRAHTGGTYATRRRGSRMARACQLACRSRTKLPSFCARATLPCIRPQFPLAYCNGTDHGEAQRRRQLVRRGKVNIRCDVWVRAEPRHPRRFHGRPCLGARRRRRLALLGLLVQRLRHRLDPVRRGTLPPPCLHEHGGIHRGRWGWHAPVHVSQQTPGVDRRLPLPLAFGGPCRAPPLLLGLALV